MADTRNPQRLAPNCKPLEPPLDGWYAVEGRTVILSFVVSRDEGKGHVTGLLDRWMTEYDVIQVPTPLARMRSICERRGFVTEWVWAPEYGEHVEVMVWRRG